MLKIEVELSEGAKEALQVVVDDFNDDTGQALKLEEWAALRLTEAAIFKPLNAEVDIIRQGVDEEVKRRIAARRRELLDALDAL